MSTLTEIERATREYAAARNVVSERVQRLNDEIEALKRRFLPGIKSAVQTAIERQASLKAEIEESPELFKKPRTVPFHGIKVGYQKQKGKVEWEDSSFVVLRLKKLFPDNWQDYVKITEKPVKSALSELSVAELKKIGVTAEETGDVVLIKPTDSDIDKIVAALLKEEEIGEEAA